MIEKRLRRFRKPHCGSVRIDETYVKIRGQWRYLYRAIDKHGTAVDFLLTARRDAEAAKRFFRKILKDEPLLSPETIGTDGAGTFPTAIHSIIEERLLKPDPVHHVTKHLQQGIESDHFRVKKAMPRIGGFCSLNTARRTIKGFEAMLWLKKGFGLTGEWTVRRQNELVVHRFGLQQVNKPEDRHLPDIRVSLRSLRQARRICFPIVRRWDLAGGRKTGSRPSSVRQTLSYSTVVIIPTAMW